jgi:CIC family chloride channel protein
VVVASVFGVTVAQGLADAGYGGTHEEGALFQMPAAMLDYHFTYHEILPYLALGIGCGLVGWLFARSLTLSEEFWHRRPWPMIVKPVIGGLLLGLIGVCFRLGFGKVFTHYGPPPFFGNGYPAIEAMLDPAAYLGPDAMVAARLTLIYLAVLTAAKIVGTSLTLGSGASGGTFAPCLFIGAAFGGAYGSALRDLAWVGPVGPAAYALAGMAGVLSAAVHCPLTAFVLVFEITGDYKVILPVMLVTVSATVVNQLLMRESIYTATLREMGVRVDRLNELTLLRRIEVSAVPLGPAVIVRPHDSGQQLVEAARDSATADVIVCGEDRKYLGIVLAHDLRTALLEREAVPLVVASDLMRTDVPTVTPSETLDSVFDKFTRFDTASLAVVGEGGRVLGVITRARLIRHYEKTAEES